MIRSLLVLLAVLMAGPVFAQTRLAVIVVDFPTSLPAPTQTMDWTRETMANVDAFYAEQSYQQFTLTSDVFGIYTVPLDINATRNDVAQAAQQAATTAGVNLTPYTKFLYISPLTNVVRGGWGDASGAWIAALPDYPAAPQFQTAAHELGHHLFGLLHAHGLVCHDGTPLGTEGGPCVLSDYGNTLDVMGQGHGHFNALVKRSRGWLTPSGPQQILTVTADGDYFIQPFETLGGVKALLVSGTGKYAWRMYAIEYRQPIGFDAPQPWADPANVFHGATVHLALNGSELLKMTPSPDGDIDTPALLVGQTYCDRQAKIEVSVLSADSAGLLVHVNFGNCR